MFEASERQVAQSGVFVVADVVLNPCAATVAAFDLGDGLLDLVGEDRSKAMPVMIGER